MSPPPKYSIDRIAHARGSPIQWIPDVALFTAQRLEPVRAAARAVRGPKDKTTLSKLKQLQVCGDWIGADGS